ncbi:MAG: response regulator [Elusimicrobiota bacterium]
MGKIFSENIPKLFKKLVSLLSQTQNIKNTKQYKILIAEDEPVGRELFKMMFEKKYELIFAENGIAAVEMFIKHKPNIVLMDIMMPEMDGFEAYTKIRELEFGKKTPIIAITARAMKSESEIMLKHGFNGFILKPIDVKLLYQTIQNLIF